MASFKDTNGKSWTLSLDAPTIRLLRNELKVDLADMDGKAYEQLAADPVLLVDALWLLVREQAEHDGVTDQQFGRALRGDVLEGATTALLETICDFFPQRKRELVQALAAKNQKVRELGMAKLLERINDPELEQRAVAAIELVFDQHVSQALTQLSNATASPGLLASPPADSPSAS